MSSAAGNKRSSRETRTNQPGLGSTATNAQLSVLRECPPLNSQPVMTDAIASAHVGHVPTLFLSSPVFPNPVPPYPLMRMPYQPTQIESIYRPFQTAQPRNVSSSNAIALAAMSHQQPTIFPRQPSIFPQHVDRFPSNSVTPGNHAIEYDHFHFDNVQTVSSSMTPREKEVSEKLIEISLNMHKSKEYVAPERVIDKLFQHFCCGTWKELGVYSYRLTPLDNLNNRVKRVTLYVQTLKETFNLCTLYELEPLLVKFLEVNRYEDIQLGPLEKNPVVQNAFNYDPRHQNQPIIPVTNSDVIRHFVNFSRNRRGPFETYQEDFLHHLARTYRLHSWRELGLLLGSFKYLLEVSHRVQRDLKQHEEEVIEKVSVELLEAVHANFNELKEKMHTEQQLSSYTKKKTPLAVFNHLTSIIGKYFHFLPHQSAAYAALMVLRDNEFLRYLLNLSIYLGTIENSETLHAQLKKFHAEVYPNQDLFEFENRIETQEKLRKKDRRKFRSMKRKKNKENNLSSQESDDEGGHHLTTSVDPRRSKPSIRLQELCSEIYTLLSNYHTLLTIEQLADIDKRLCHHYGVNNFAQLNFDDIQLAHFLHKYREQIDPHQQLAIYDEQSFLDDREDIRSFVQQLNMFDSSTTVYQEPMSIPVNRDLGYEHNSIGAEKWSTVDKALKHKFGQSISFRRGKSILTEASRSSIHFHKHSIVRFEESLLDIYCLDRLDICPASLNVDENQLCKVISNAPLMIDLYQWLQWLDFFQPKYGHLPSFLTKHEVDFQGILFLETSKSELVRLPFNASTKSFEQELFAMNISSAVGHLCSLIVQEGFVSRLSFSVLQTSMETWFHRLQASEILNNDLINPLRLILEFLMFLPLFIGQSRVIEELILEPLNQVFRDEPNIRLRVWNLADGKQRTKLEFWAHTINISEWINDKKWAGEINEEPTSFIQVGNPAPREENDRKMETENPSIHPQRSVEIQPKIPSTEMIRPTVDDVQSFHSAVEHIESIRRGFGVDDNLNDTGKYVVTKLHGVLERSLEKLSTDLYSEEGHFVLELIQNADDNHYDSVVPTLRFIVSTKRILVLNNELGFQPENISAICNVGASTKGKHKQGYTGHKGIGFKSVFMISHQPEIHSGNYHIRFDTMNGKQQIGYILPIWVDQYEESLPDLNQWRTCIRLPIKDDVRTDNLKQKFDNIQGKLLLFLNRVRQIEISHEQENIVTTKVFSRFDHANGQIIELQEKLSNETTHRNLWLVVKKIIQVPEDIKNKLREVKGPVDWTTIAIAYPLEGIENSSSTSLQSQPLFAYLPLRSYGFRFILQADFEIPANRQDIRRDNLWNEWLKTEMPLLLFLAYEQFQRLPELLSALNINDQQLTPIQTIKYFLKFLPSRHEVDPYFRTFINKSFQLLTGVLKFPVINPKSAKESEKISWVFPSQCTLVRDQFIRTILSEDLLLAHFNSYYLHEELMNECDEKLLLALGCRLLDSSDVTKLMELSYRTDDQGHPKTESTIKEVAQWLICLDYSLQQQREQNSFDPSRKKKDDTFDRLKQLKIIPLQSSSHLVSLDEYQHNTIFFPLDTSKNYARHLRLILDDVPILDDRLTRFIEDQYPRRFQSCRKLLENFGIKDIPRIQDIYRQHILPTMEDPKRWSTKSNELLIAYVISIFDYLYKSEQGLSENEINQLQKSMLIKTQENKFLSVGTEKNFVHLTRTYGARRSMESLNLPKDQVHFISDDYYLQYRQTVLRGDSDQRVFLRFLHELRIDDFLQMEYRSTPFANTEQLDETQWKYHKDELVNLIHEPFFINDYRCEEFEVLISPEPNYDLCVQLFQYLQDHYRSTSQYYSASVVKSRHQKIGQNEPVVTIKSSFHLALRTHPWIPVTDGKLCKPGDVYCLPSCYDPFRQYVAHLDLSKVSIKDQNFIFNILGIQNAIPVKILFGLLMKWSSNVDQEQLDNLIQSTESFAPIPCSLVPTFRHSCSESIEKIRQIYSFLIDNEETRLLLARFRLWPLVYLPQDDSHGYFVFVHKVYWQNYGTEISIGDAVLDTNSRRAIGSYYQDNRSLSTLFLDILAVEHQPNIDDYLPLLSKTNDLDQTWKLIAILTRLSIEQKKELELQDKCRDLDFIPCVDVEHKLMKFTDRPLYPHDSDLAELFADLVPIIKLPSFELPFDIKEKFCALFNLRSLSEVIRVDVEVKNKQISTTITDFYRQSIDLIQIYLLINKILSDERSKHFASVFDRMQFFSVDDIQLSFSYQSTCRELPTHSVPKGTYIDETAAKFYILKDFEKSYICYIRAMAEFLLQDSTHQGKLSSFIENLLPTYQKDRQQGLNKMREKYTITYEPKWTISEGEVLLEEEKPDVKVPEEIVDATDEEIKAEMEKPSWRRNLPPKKLAQKAEKGNMVTDGSLQLKPTSSHPVQNHSHVSSSYQQVASNHQNDRQTTTEDSNRDPLKPTSLNISEEISRTPIQFENIVISTLTDLNLSKMNTNIETLSTDVDEQTGYCGEELVFLVLKRQHPNDEVRWMNAEGESRKPYDIYRKLSNGQEEFIEVKTTKNFNQHSFFVSVAEVKFFLQYPNNSSIYRVYYAHPVESSIIIRINQIEENLQRHNFKLVMTICSKPNDITSN